MIYKEALNVKVGDKLGFKYYRGKEIFGEIKCDNKNVINQLDYLRKITATVKKIDIKPKDVFFYFEEIDDIVNHRDIGYKNPVILMGNKSFKI